MAQPGAETPQQAQLQQPQAMPAVESTDNLAGAVPVAVVDEGEPTQYQIVRSQTGKNYVQADDYDPLEHHRSRDPSANKGQGLGFLFCCCGSKTAEDADEQK